MEKTKYCTVRPLEIIEVGTLTFDISDLKSKIPKSVVDVERFSTKHTIEEAREIYASERGLSKDNECIVHRTVGVEWYMPVN